MPSAAGLAFELAAAAELEAAVASVDAEVGAADVVSVAGVEVVAELDAVVAGVAVLLGAEDGVELTPGAVPPPQALRPKAAIARAGRNRAFFFIFPQKMTVF